MNNSRTIQTSKSSDLITHKILIEGEELSSVYQVKNIAIEKEINRIPFAQLVLVDGEAAAQEFALSNADLFVPGATVEIKVGYHNDEETLFKGLVIKHSVKIRESASAVIVECRDEAVKMTVGRKSSYYYDQTDAEIIEEIIGNYGLEATVETTQHSHSELIQYHCSDWDFVITRAQASGLLCFIEDGKLQITPPDLTTDPVETIAYGATLLSFDGEIDARNQFESIKAYAWNPADQEVVEVDAEAPSVELNGNITSSDLAAVVDLDTYELRHGGNVSDTELQSWSDAKALFQQIARTRGRVKFQGIPAVKPGVLLTLEGVGDRFNGSIYVSAVRHEIVDGNWTVNAQFGLPEKWFSETYEINSKPGSGIIPAINGLQIGVVTQLQDDPDGEDKILVQLPIINHEEQGVWARVATLDAGENRGSFFRPEIEDEVIVGFINDDPNDAVILGMLHSSSKPAPLVASDDNHHKGFVTRSEMKMIFDDEKISYTLETPAGKKVVLDEDDGTIVIEDEHSNKITMDSSGISLESKGDVALKSSGDLNFEATNINIKAKAQLLAEGGAGAEFSTSAIATVKGSLVQIN